MVLVEGDSERIVLPKLAEALDLLVAPAFVAIVPLGGRHVQHFWRLLEQLGIPYATLLDLDLGRKGGRFGRIKTAIEKLIERGKKKNTLLLTTNGVLTDAQFAKMHEWTRWIGFRAGSSSCRNMASISPRRSTSTWQCSRPFLRPARGNIFM